MTHCLSSVFLVEFFRDDVRFLFFSSSKFAICHFFEREGERESREEWQIISFFEFYFRNFYFLLEKESVNFAI